MCSNHATVRGVLKEIPDDYGMVMIDLDASPEHLTRGTTRHLDHLLIVAEPYFKSLETARRFGVLARDLGIPEVSIIANKIKEGDLDAVEEFCRQHGFEIAGAVPFDSAFGDAERAGRAPIDFEKPIGALGAIERLAASLEGNV